MKNIRTDLALEANELFGADVKGVSVEREAKEGTTITRIAIESEAGAKALDKAVGKYVTIESPELKSTDKAVYETACRLLSEELRAMADLSKYKTVLVVGLGNANVTPDALGPKTVSKLMVTRHLREYMPEQLGENIRPVCALAPGVLGLTGVETGEVVRGVAEKVRPDLILAVDALAARNIDRVSATLQLCDAGISPGSGVGNKRKALNEETLGVPVIAVGVPTVIDAAAIVGDAFDLALDALMRESGEGNAFFEALAKIDRDAQFELIREAVSPRLGSFVVTPKDVDAMIEKLSKVVANGVNLALHDEISFEDIELFLA
jgi:spore protease